MNTPNVNVIVSSNSNNYNGDAFDVISTENPPTVFSRQELPLAIPDGVDNNGSPIQTNKFYANLFLGDQTDMIWSWPYGMKWSNENYYGFGIQHTNVSDRQFGSQDTNNFGVPSYYFNPVGTSEIIFSSPSLSSTNNHLSVSDMESMSVNVKLAPSSTLGSDYIELPIVQGMGFVTAIYHGDMVPLLNSLIGIQTFTKETSTVLNSRTLKYRATLFNGVEWLIYVSLPNSSTSFELDVKNPFNIEGSSAIDGVIIQVAVAPETSNLQKRDGASMEGYYDQSCGQYVTNADIVGTISSGVAAQYGFQYSTEGSSSCGSPIVFALPHHVESLTASTSQFATGIRLASTTKGNMYAYLTDKLMMSETLETDVQFLPWSKQMSKSLTYSPEQLVLLAKTANEELQVDIASSVASMDSNYFSGKVLDKYAYILLVVHEIIQDEAVTKATLEQMKTAFDLFINNKQYFPLMYDTKFGGVTSTSAQGGDTGADFGSAYYNDHHFHYGYFVHAAAIVGKVDKDLGGNWAETNKDWVNSLVRDVANPSKSDPHFPVYRMFDWFAGHSWAAGLFASGDGKNQESSSEDYNFAYGMKLWGKVIGNDAMESRGDLMLAVMSRAMNKYILYSDDNDVEPSTILPNKVAGIIFENKITYTTYFGSPNVHPEYVHGIHMLPITPASSLIRNPTFVQQEWNEQVETFIDNVDSGWTGILKLNQALYDPDASYDFFSSSSWSSSCLDNGQSRTWSLAYAGGVSNSV
jgi:endo-1,3(4)-beta-glucanase